MSGSVEKAFHPNGSPFDSDQWSEHFGCDFCYLWTLRDNDYEGVLEGSRRETESDAFYDTLDGNKWKLVFRIGFDNMTSLMSMASKPIRRKEVKFFASVNFLDKSGAIYSPAGRSGVKKVEVADRHAKWNVSELRLSDFEIPFEIDEHLESVGYCNTLRILLRMWTLPADKECEASCAPPAFATNFGSILDDPVFADVTLQVGTAQILAHGAVLAARSFVFREQLLAASKEIPSGMMRLNLSDYSPSVVRGMLKYLYTDDYAKGTSVGETLGVIAMAHAHKLERLRSKVSLVGNPKFEELATTHLKEVLAVLAKATETTAKRPKLA